MNRPLALLSALAAVALLGACDSHSWEKETSQLFHKKGAHGADSHAAPAAPEHGKEAAKPH
jgi:hypothetical protein